MHFPCRCNPRIFPEWQKERRYKKNNNNLCSNMYLKIDMHTDGNERKIAK